MSAATPVPLTCSLVVPATGSTTTASTVLAAGWPISGMVILAALQGMSGPSLDIYIQESWNYGTPGATVAWSDVAHFPQVLGNSGQVTTRVSITTAGDAEPETVGTGTTAAPGVALAAGTFCDGPWAPWLRVVAVTGSQTPASSVTQTITLYAWRPSQGT